MGRQPLRDHLLQQDRPTNKGVAAIADPCFDRQVAVVSLVATRWPEHTRM
jgi:hypothetical protein